MFFLYAFLLDPYILCLIVLFVFFCSITGFIMVLSSAWNLPSAVRALTIFSTPFPSINNETIAIALKQPFQMYFLCLMLLSWNGTYQQTKFFLYSFLTIYLYYDGKYKKSKAEILVCNWKVILYKSSLMFFVLWKNEIAIELHCNANKKKLYFLKHKARAPLYVMVFIVYTVQYIVTVFLFQSFCLKFIVIVLFSFAVVFTEPKLNIFLFCLLFLFWNVDNVYEVVFGYLKQKEMIFIYIFYELTCPTCAKLLPLHFYGCLDSHSIRNKCLFNDFIWIS